MLYAIEMKYAVPSGKEAAEIKALCFGFRKFIGACKPLFTGPLADDMIVKGGNGARRNLREWSSRAELDRYGRAVADLVERRSSGDCKATVTTMNGDILFGYMTANRRTQIWVKGSHKMGFSLKLRTVFPDRREKDIMGPVLATLNAFCKLDLNPDNKAGYGPDNPDPVIFRPDVTVEKYDRREKRWVKQDLEEVDVA